MADITPRVRTVVRALADHGLAGTLATYGFSHYLLLLQRTPRLESDAARKLNAALMRLGGLYATFAHFLAGRPDLTQHSTHFSNTLPTEPALPAEHLKKTIEDAFNKSFASMYSHLDPRPLASTPLSQTHKARTTSGKPVSITVKRLPATFTQDLAVIRFMAQKLHKHNPSSLAIHAAFERHLKKTLDYRGQFNTPGLHRTHSNRHVLTRDYVDTPHRSI